MTCKRSGAGVGVIDGILYAVGGHDGPVVRDTVEAFDPNTNRWELVASMSFSRRNAGIRIIQLFSISDLSKKLKGFHFLKFFQELSRITAFYMWSVVMMEP